MTIDRKLTHPGGGTAKFWQVSQDGGELKIRYGRLGAAGRTQVKAFGSAAEATEAADKLVAEKLRKGYVEGDAPAGQAAPADEDRFTMPPAWLRELHPRRGGTRVAAGRPDSAAPAKVAAALGRDRQVILDCLALCSDPEIAAAGRAYLADGLAGTPLGAAVVAAVVATYQDAHDRTTLGAFAETWLAERGLAFAAVAVAELSSLKCWGDQPYYAGRETAMPVRRRAATDGSGSWFSWSRIALPARVRAAVAAASDADYAEAVAALEACRAEGPHQRVAASFLAPTEIAWVDADCAEIAQINRYYAEVLVAAISTPEQAALIADQVWVYRVACSLDLPATIVDGMGEAATPILARWLDLAEGAEEERRLAAVLVELPTDAAMQALIDRAKHKYGRPALLRAAARYPRRAMRLLAAADGKLAGELLRAHVLAHPGLVTEVSAQVGRVAAERIGAIVSTAAAVETAPPEALPEVLRDPPWTRRRKAREPVVVSGLTCTDEPALGWAPGERDAWLPVTSEQHYYHHRDWKRIAGAPGTHGSDLMALFAIGPEELARPLVETWRPAEVWDAAHWMRGVVARFELAALPLALHCARKSPVQIARALLPFADPEVAVLMADCLARLKSVRATALAWLDRHPDAAARALVPAALGTLGPARRQAEEALTALIAAGHRDAVRRAADGHGPAAEAAISGLLDADPLDTLPARMPTLPGWADPSILTPLHLRDGAGALPVEAARHMIMMLAISRPGEPYPGVALVKESCDPRSLAEFGWALFQRWQATGHPAKESWMFHALGLIGDDETVRGLTPLIRAWPGEGGHARAVTGLDILAAIGTDVALMHLHGIAERVKFGGLKERARQKLAEVAARLGLTSHELADRLVPDFGLAADGSLTLDYGRRRFVVGFDEQLKPYITDAAGKRLKTLPKPGAADDAELAPAAYRRFAALKKDVRTVAADAISRLELAMVERRRWSGEEFTRLFVGHPLLWHIVRRLVWGVYDASGDPIGALRVAEDRGFADVEDEELTLPADALIGVAHPLDLPETLSAWAEVFADYEILQPFPQLGREVYAADAAEAARMESAKVPTGRVIGLERRGWRRGAPQDAGIQCWLERDVPGGGSITIGLNPGIAVGDIEFWGEQSLVGVPTGTDDLDPITLSEILRDLREITR
ncbi:WGR and DUF4132 domain-containing protein [Spongiactinospora sp. 9N601]|uniref:WGR and DUF4132 domain-containing protein n=1 Tax=Spongiactinospora sp. 9N601 TaxID=3375149 RepID=UPI0037AC1960